MGRSAVLEGVDQEAELVLRLFLAEAQNLEHPLLDLGVVNTDGASAEFVAVEHEVVGIGADLGDVLLLVAEVPVQVLRFRGREWMVHGIPAVLLLVPLKEREVHDPQRGEDLGVAQAQAAPHLKTQNAEHGLYLAAAVPAQDQCQVAFLRFEGFADFPQIFRREKFVDGRLDGPVLVEFDVDQPLGTDLRALNPFGQFVQLLAGIISRARHTDASDILRRVKHAKTFSLRERGDLVNGHAEADVRFVGTVAVHRVEPVHTRKGIGNIHVQDILE